MIRTLFARIRQHFRRKRYQIILDLLRLDNSNGFILDLGGGPASFFAAIYPRPEQIVLLEINPRQACQAKRSYRSLQVIIANGEQLPLANCSIGATVCNSVIEHVHVPDMLAAEICRVSRSYFLQTPNGDFPLETHSYIAIPFYNLVRWLWLQQLMCKIFGANFEYVNSVRYLSEQRLKSLFPQAKVTYEKVFDLKKSFYVYYPLAESLE